MNAKEACRLYEEQQAAMKTMVVDALLYTIEENAKYGYKESHIGNSAYVTSYGSLEISEPRIVSRDGKNYISLDDILEELTLNKIRSLGYEVILSETDEIIIHKSVEYVAVGWFKYVVKRPVSKSFPWKKRSLTIKWCCGKE